MVQRSESRGRFYAACKGLTCKVCSLIEFSSGHNHHKDQTSYLCTTRRAKPSTRVKMGLRQSRLTSTPPRPFNLSTPDAQHLQPSTRRTSNWPPHCSLSAPHLSAGVRTDLASCRSLCHFMTIHPGVVGTMNTNPFVLTSRKELHDYTTLCPIVGPTALEKLWHRSRAGKLAKLSKVFILKFKWLM